MMHLASHSFNDGRKGLFHVPRLLPFIVRPFEVEPRHGNTPLIHHVRVNLAVAMIVRDHFAAPGKSYEGAVILASTLFQLFSIAVLGGSTLEGPDLRHPIAASNLNVVATRKT